MMDPRRTSAALLLALLPAAPLWADYSFPPEKRGDVEARLGVRVAGRAAVQGFGEVTLTLEVTGPAALEVEPPRLADATAAWKPERVASSWALEDGQATWGRTIGLRQVKPGAMPLPELALRFRDGPAADWQEVKWVDILRQTRDVPAPEPPLPPPPSWLRRWWPALAGGVLTLLLLGGAWGSRRRWAGRPTSLSPEQWALREIDRIDGTLLPPQGDPEAYHTQLSHVVRRYLAERFGLHALQQTTAEFLESVRQAPQLAPPRQAMLRDLFERCDLAKFARASTPPEECRRSAELARDIVGGTAPADQGGVSAGRPASMPQPP